MSYYSYSNVAFNRELLPVKNQSHILKKDLSSKIKIKLPRPIIFKNNLDAESVTNGLIHHFDMTIKNINKKIKACRFLGTMMKQNWNLNVIKFFSRSVYQFVYLFGQCGMVSSDSTSDNSTI